MTWGYSAYGLDAAGRIQNRVDILCDNDKETKRLSQQILDRCIIELCQERRMVATFSPIGTVPRTSGWYGGQLPQFLTAAGKRAIQSQAVAIAIIRAARLKPPVINVVCR